MRRRLENHGGMPPEEARTAARLVAAVLCAAMVFHPLFTLSFALGSPHPVAYVGPWGELGTTCGEARTDCFVTVSGATLAGAALLVAAALAAYLGSLRGRRAPLLASAGLALVWWLPDLAGALLRARSLSAPATLPGTLDDFALRILLGLAFAALLAGAAMLQPARARAA